MIECGLPFAMTDALPNENTDDLPVDIVVTPVKVVMKRIRCKKCGNTLISQGVSIINPDKYGYHCPICNNDYISTVKYPAICFVKSEED